MGQYMFMAKYFTVYAELDEETGRWTAFSDDIPGLTLEVADLEELDREIKCMVPELLALNNEHIDSKSIPIRLQTTRQLSVSVA